MVTGQLPDRVHPTGSETKYHVFNNQITDNVDMYHSKATTHKPKACTMKYTKKNIRAHTIPTYIQTQTPEIIYEHLPYCSYQSYHQVNPNRNDCMKLLHVDNISRKLYYSFNEIRILNFMQCVPCIYAIHTLYLHGTYIEYDITPSAMEDLLSSKIHDLFSHPYLYAMHRGDFH